VQISTLVTCCGIAALGVWVGASAPDWAPLADGPKCKQLGECWQGRAGYSCFTSARLPLQAYFTRRGRDLTLQALTNIDIMAKNVGRINPALVATAITYLVLILCIYLMALWRSFIEAAHDASGEWHSAHEAPLKPVLPVQLLTHMRTVAGAPAKGAMVFLVLAGLFITVWFCGIYWIILLLNGATVWATTLYVMYKSCAKALKDLTVSDAPPPGERS
jgi:hypothetical protein